MRNPGDLRSAGIIAQFANAADSAFKAETLADAHHFNGEHNAA